MTDFDEIYCLNLVMKNDPRLAKIPTNQYYSLCWKYLQVAISRFEYESIPNIRDLVPFSETDYEFVCDGESNEFQLQSLEMTQFPKFYVSYIVGDSITEIIDYSYDVDTNVLTINCEDGLLEDAILKVAAYDIGHFNVDLGYREKEILAQGMLIPFLEENVNRESLLNQFVYGGSTKIHSQAEHLKTITNALAEQQKLVKNLIIDYTYRASLDKYAGLGTRKEAGGKAYSIIEVMGYDNT